MAEPRKPNGLNKKATLVLLAVSLASIIAINYSLPLFFGGEKESVDTGHITVGNITIHVNFKSIPAITKVNVTSTYANATVYDIMKSEFMIGHHMYQPYGLYIEYIDNQGPSWTYKVNGVPPGYSSTKYIVTNNSIITWNQS